MNKNRKLIYVLLSLFFLTLSSFTLAKYTESENYSVFLTYTKAYDEGESTWLDPWENKPTPPENRLQTGIYAVQIWGADGGINYKGVTSGNSAGLGGYVTVLMKYDASQDVQFFVGGTSVTASGGSNDGGNATANAQVDFGYGGGGSSYVMLDGVKIAQGGGGGGAGNSALIEKDETTSSITADPSGATGGEGGTLYGTGNLTSLSSYYNSTEGAYIFPGKDGQGHDKSGGSMTVNRGGVGGSVTNSNNNKDSATNSGAGGGGGFYPGAAGTPFIKMTDSKWSFKAGAGGGGGASMVKEETGSVHIIPLDSSLYKDTTYNLNLKGRPLAKPREGCIIFTFLGDGKTAGETWADFLAMANS